MKDCVKTLHAVMRDPDELARVQHDLNRAWAEAMTRPKKAPRGRIVANGEAARRVRCPVAKRVILTTEKHWSEK